MGQFRHSVGLISSILKREDLSTKHFVKQTSVRGKLAETAQRVESNGQSFC